ncbi:TldD/PmbA family protein [Plectonema cf. radiosum LEGE 06105]|uniref:TldD/PmbA family protein n=1 Tax=Plectonema cf. radiosum LEGE 06105 TaxID=945769 RepID=A0A8J7F985_9CYAN|nr:TldD/PmbA family protein [Plectonema radiosum]MBE9217203.1 TldD/PmbA family protein [Plectonema cf. radiosum LEGE 06105]
MWSELKKAINNIDVSADWIGIRAVTEISSNRFIRDGLPQSNGKSSTLGAMVEVLVNGCLGYGATNSLDFYSLQAAATAAYKQALAASEWWIYPFQKASERPKVVGEYISPSVGALDALSPGEINDLLVRICNTLKVDDKIVQTTASASTTEKNTWFISSNGSEIYQKFLLFSTHFGATAQDGLIVQQRTNNGWSAHCYQGLLEFKEEDLWYRVREVGEQAVELLTAEECPNTRTNLVLAPDQMMLQIHESVGHPLEIDRILGDERNYAGGSFVKTDDFGNLKYGSNVMNITFDPTVKGEFASYGFDDTGAIATREYVVKEGVLQRGLGSLESQARSRVSGVACARACSWNRPPIDRMANLNLEPGSASFEEIIGGIKNGVYMESNRSWSIDDRRYKFQFGCEYGKLIEDGKLTKTLRNPNYRATTPEFWHSLIKVGNKSTWKMYGTAYCGKGEPNQAISVGHGSPVCLFTNVEVFGGG